MSGIATAIVGSAVIGGIAVAFSLAFGVLVESGLVPAGADAQSREALADAAREGGLSF